MEWQCNGVQLAGEQRGEGPPVTLVHGWTMSRDLWRAQMPVLAEHYRVVSYDLRGHGESAKPLSGPYGLEAHVEDLHQLLNHLDITETALVGWSMGASVAVAFAAEHPERVRKLILVDGSPMLVARPDFSYAMPPDQAGVFLTALGHDYTGAMKVFVSDMLQDANDTATRDWILSVAEQCPPSIALATIQAVGTADLRPLIKQISLPTLVMHGDADPVCLPAAGRYMADAIPGANLHMFPGARHCPFLDQPDAFNARLLEFLAAS